jgi:hypothetical protein
MAALGAENLQQEENKAQVASVDKKNSIDSQKIDSSRSSQGGGGYGFLGKLAGRIVGGIQNQFGVSSKSSAQGGTVIQQNATTP